ncbi:MAG: hypothetical protein IT366_25060 [Candidatus Hydrogenedentes bacterium]|nr:hypothetical protein [Candidatus Hydrogenedentota bacterium]
MKKFLKFAGIALAIVLVICAIALFYVNSKYDFLFAGPQISHETLMTPGVRIRAVAKPALARPIVSKLLGASAPSPWILDRVIPYEAALLASPDLGTGRIDIKLFLNPQRLAPIIAQAADSYAIPQKIGFITWPSQTFDVSTRGVLSLDGFVDIDDATANLIKSEWGTVQLPNLPAFEGGHLGEVSIDNRDGSLFTVISVFANQGTIALPMPAESLRKTIAPIATMSLHTDLTGDDELAIHIIVDCQPTAEEGQVTGVNFALGGIIGELSRIAGDRGATLAGNKKAEGITITGDYTLKNLSALLKM